MAKETLNDLIVQVIRSPYVKAYFEGETLLLSAGYKEILRCEKEGHIYRASAPGSYFFPDAFVNHPIFEEVIEKALLKRADWVDDRGVSLKKERGRIAAICCKLRELFLGAV